MHKPLTPSKLLACSIALAMSQSAVATQWVGRFAPSSAQIPAPWTLVKLNATLSPTQYKLTQWDGVTAIEAIAKQSMALMARPLTIDLTATPVLCWRWRIDAPLKMADMRTKQGDDYAARLYVTFRAPSGALSFGTRTKLALARSLFGDQVPDAALNYVWDNRYPVGTKQANAYTDRAQMVVLRSGAAAAGQWVNERRDIAADVRAAFGAGAWQAAQLAVASDTDNTGESARAGFADLHFVAVDAPCELSS